MDIQKVLRKVSSYLVKYREKQNLTQQEMAAMIGLSISRYSELERNMGHAGLSLKSLMIIAGLEHQSLTDFLMTLETKASAKKGASSGDLYDEFQGLPTALKTSLTKKIRKKVSRNAVIKDRPSWAFEMMNMVLDGSLDDQINHEIYLLQYFLCHQAKDESMKKIAKNRLNKLLRSK